MPWDRICIAAALWVMCQITAVSAAEQLIIATSPSMRVPVEALGRQFEKTHPNVNVRLYFDSGLDLRRTIAGMENNPRGQFFIGSGPLHLVARERESDVVVRRGPADAAPGGHLAPQDSGVP